MLGMGRGHPQVGDAHGGVGGGLPARPGLRVPRCLRLSPSVEGPLAFPSWVTGHEQASRAGLWFGGQS